MLCNQALALRLWRSRKLSPFISRICTWWVRRSRVRRNKRAFQWKDRPTNAGEALRTEDLGPFVEGQIGCDDDGAALVALGDDLEEQLGAGLAEGDKAQLVDDQQVLAGLQLLQTLQAPFVGGLDQFMNEGRGGGEADLHALLAGRQPEAQCYVGLAGTARPERDDVLAPIDELTAGEFHDKGLVERRDGLEVEAVQALGGRELRGLDAPLDHPALALAGGGPQIMIWRRPPPGSSSSQSRRRYCT